MQSILQEFKIGKGEDISVHVGAKDLISDEVLWDREGSSILYPLLHQVYHLLTGYYPAKQGDLKSLIYGRSDGYFFENSDMDEFNYTWAAISSISGDNPVTVNLGGYQAGFWRVSPVSDFRNRTDISASNIVGLIITNLPGNTDLQGFITDFNYVNQTTFEINNVSLTGNEDVSNAFITPVFDRDSYMGGQNGREVLNDIQFIARHDTLALGRSAVENKIEDQIVHEPIMDGDGAGELRYNPQTLQAPTHSDSQQRSTLTVSREVDNQSGADIRCREIALIARTSIDYYNDFIEIVNGFPLARDVIDVTVGADSIVSFNHSIRTTASASEGIMENFLDMFYRQLQRTNRNVQDTNNNDRNDGPSKTQFDLRDYDGFISENVGVVVGSGTKNVDIGDFALDNLIVNGINDGELFRVGTFVDDIVMDEDAGTAYFDVSTLYENRGSVSVDIEEVGLYTGGPSGTVLIARAKPGSTQTVAAGDTAKATFRFSVNV